MTAKDTKQKAIRLLRTLLVSNEIKTVAANATIAEFLNQVAAEPTAKDTELLNAFVTKVTQITDELDIMCRRGTVKDPGVLACVIDLREAIGGLACPTPSVSQERDQNWILAMAEALGTNSGIQIPIIPEAKVFREFFTAIRKAQGAPHQMTTREEG